MSQSREKKFATPDRIVVRDIIIEKGVTSKEIKRSCLDTPRLGHASSIIRVSGWVILQNPLNLVKTSVLVNGYKKFFLNKERKDVVDKIIKDDPDRVKHLKCGFFFDLNVSDLLDGVVSLSLSVGDKVIPWKRMVFEPVSSVEAVWENYSTNNLKSISAEDGLLLEGLKKEEVERLLFIRGSLLSIAQASADKRVKKEKKYFELFLKFLSAPDFTNTLVSSAINTGVCCIPSPFEHGKEAVCSESFNLPNLTILRFVDASDETFFIVQQVTSADLVFFPKRKFAVRIKHASEDIYLNSVFLIFNKFSKVLAYSKSANRAFRGIVASFPRPYHFFYEILHGMDFLYKKDVLKKVPEIIYSPGSAFYSFKDLYGLTCKEHSLDLRTLRDENFSLGQFVVQVGIGFSSENIASVKEIDQFLVSHATKSITLEESKGLDEARNCFPLISFGITIEKRSWLEQAEAISSIINFLALRFPGMGVVFDGWTMPINSTEKDQTRAAEFKDFVSLLEKTIPSYVSVFSTIGATSKRKIAFAKLVDCFVANSGTDILHVARFMKKPGIGHNCKAMKSVPEHFAMCPNLRHVDDEFITDIPDEKSNAKGVGFLSYSIKSEVVQKMLLDLLAEDVIKNRLSV